MFDQTTGATGTVIGSITTDGNTGTLGTSDIIAWTLTLNGNGASFTISSTDSNAFKEVVGPDLTAAKGSLLFNFGGPTGTFLLQDGAFSGNTYYCDQAVTGGGPCFNGESIIPVSYNSPSAVVSNPLPAEDQVIGSEVAVPEPSTWALMMLGFGAIGYGAHRRARMAAAIG